MQKFYEKNLLTIEGENLKYPKRVVKNNYIFYTSYQVFLYNQMLFVKSFINNRKNLQISNEFLPWFLNRPELLLNKIIGNCSYDIAYSQTELKDSTKSIVYFDPAKGDYVLNINSKKIADSLVLDDDGNPQAQTIKKTNKNVELNINKFMLKLKEIELLS